MTKANELRERGEVYVGIGAKGARQAYRDAKADGRDDDAEAIADFINGLKKEGLLS